MSKRKHMFYGLKKNGYDLIVADPPWSFKTWSNKDNSKTAQHHYNVMSIDDIKKMQVSKLAKDDSVLLLWGTWPLLPQAKETMKAWGFTYKTGGHWHKVTKNGKQAMGTGYIFRGASEFFLVGTRGKFKFRSKSTRNAIVGLVRQHSRKPEEFYDWVDKWLPDVKKVELFSRQNRTGWDTWGNETGKFNES